MTQDERDLLFGRTERTVRETKAQLAAMKAKAADVAGRLRAMALVLEGKGSCIQIQQAQVRIALESGKIIEGNLRAEWPSWDAIQALASDLEAAQNDLNEAERRYADIKGSRG